LSTNLPRTNLKLIFDYGREALGNRRKDLFLIALTFLALPQIALLVVWGQASTDAVAIMDSLREKSSLQIIEDVFSSVSAQVFAWTALATILGLVGVLALARTCVDYFESRPATIGNVSARAARVLLTKGFGSAFLLALMMPILTVLPLLRAVAISLLVMLPITLVTSPNGGFKTTWDSIFLKYATKTPYGRWPTFINVLTVTGLFLTALFGIGLLLDMASVLDTITELNDQILGREIKFSGVKIGLGNLISESLYIIWESTWIALLCPFTAATYHLVTLPQDHVHFETKA